MLHNNASYIQAVYDKVPHEQAKNCYFWQVNDQLTTKI